MKKAMLVVSFGSSYENARKNNIDKTVNHIRDRFLEYDVFQAYTSIMIRKKLLKQGIEIDDVKMAIEKIKALNYDELLVVSLHIIEGFEYEKILKSVYEFKDDFNKITVTKPMLSQEEDYYKMAKLLDSLYSNIDMPIILMGHGSDHKNDISYEKLQIQLDKVNENKYYMATVEGKITIDDIIEKLETLSIKKVALTPFMLVCGDHANNDMAGDEEDSWTNILKEKGISPNPILKGLGEYELVGDYFVDKINI